MNFWCLGFSYTLFLLVFCSLAGIVSFACLGVVSANAKNLKYRLIYTAISIFYFINFYSGFERLTGSMNLSIGYNHYCMIFFIITWITTALGLGKQNYFKRVFEEVKNQLK